MSDGINYEALAQNALRYVVRGALEQVVETGLPGEHHFYIGFHTEHPGVMIPDRLRERFPEEMVIVLQHRFWDLDVEEDRFRVTLSFDQVPEELVVPFQAISRFEDPSAPFRLIFRVELPQPAEVSVPEPQPVEEPPAEPASGATNVVELDAFRRRSDP